MIIPMLCVTIFVILVVWFLLPRVARLMIHTPTAISIFVCLSMVQLMAVFISMRCTLCGHFLQVALTLILVIGRLITISTTPVIAGDSFEMDAVGALRLSPLRRGLAIDSTVDIFTFYVPHRHVYGEQWIKFMKDGVNATPLPTVNTTGYIDHAAFLGTI